MGSSSSSQNLTKPMRTKSRCTAQTASGTHSFEIVGYSLHKGIGKGKFIRSAAFAVGVYEWCILFYPDGNTKGESTGYVSVFLEMLSQDANVRACYDCRLLNQTTGSSASIRLCTKKCVFDTTVDSSNHNSSWGYTRFMESTDLEASPYLRDDRLVMGSQVAEIVDIDEVHLPPSDLPDHFVKLLMTGEGTDVTFKVKGKSFAAHSIVLAARSPVFKAQLFGMVGVDNRGCITIEDIEPGIFKALLHFIYTDSLPDIQDVEIDDIHEDEDMAKYLIVAADKYAMERLKLLCTSILCKSLDEKNVAATLALADLYNCSELRDTCIKYIASSGRVG